MSKLDELRKRFPNLDSGLKGLEELDSWQGIVWKFRDLIESIPEGQLDMVAGYFDGYVKRMNETNALFASQGLSDYIDTSAIFVQSSSLSQEALLDTVTKTLHIEEVQDILKGIPEDQRGETREIVTASVSGIENEQERFEAASNLLKNLSYMRPEERQATFAKTVVGVGSFNVRSACT